MAESKINRAGRGVFAAADIAGGEIIEMCPVIGIPDADAAHISESMLVNYIFFLGKEKNMPVLALGFGSLYNHSDSPNARYDGNSDNQVITFTAVKTIRAGEEITVDYAPQRDADSAAMWFTQ